MHCRFFSLSFYQIHFLGKESESQRHSEQTLIYPDIHLEGSVSRKGLPNVDNVCPM